MVISGVDWQRSHDPASAENHRIELVVLEEIEMRAFIMMSIITLALSEFAHAEDLFGIDKQGHFIISTGIAVASAMVLNKPEDKLTPFVITMAVGLAKEVCDQYCGGGTGFSRNDLLADAVGAYLGVVVANKALVYFTRSDKTMTLHLLSLF